MSSCCVPSACTILVIDDNDAVSTAVQLSLQHAGFRVMCAQGRSEITRLVQSVAFDLVLTDLMMPDMNGAEVLAEIKKTQPGVPVLTFSGAPHERTTDELGLSAMLGKPFSMEELITAVASVLPKCFANGSNADCAAPLPQRLA